MIQRGGLGISEEKNFEKESVEKSTGKRGEERSKQAIRVLRRKEYGSMKGSKAERGGEDEGGNEWK